MEESAKEFKEILEGLISQGGWQVAAYKEAYEKLYGDDARDAPSPFEASASGETLKFPSIA